jgi:hypothetical protein
MIGRSLNCGQINVVAVAIGRLLPARLPESNTAILAAEPTVIDRSY